MCLASWAWRLAEASAVVNGTPPKVLANVRFAVPIKLFRNKPPK